MSCVQRYPLTSTFYEAPFRASMVAQDTGTEIFHYVYHVAIIRRVKVLYTLWCCTDLQKWAVVQSQDLADAARGV
jgi:hypothetical protein